LTKQDTIVLIMIQKIGTILYII